MKTIAAIDGTLSDERGWFVVQTNPSLEARAFDNLTAAGHRVWMPLRSVFVRRRHTKLHRRVDYPLLAGYLFIDLPVVGADWWGVRRVDGVCDILGRNPDGRAVRPIERTYVDEMRSLCDAGVFNEKRAKAHWRKGQSLNEVYKPDDSVTIRTGPMAGMVFSFDDYTSRGSARIIGKLFGTLCPVEIDLSSLQVAS